MQLGTTVQERGAKAVDGIIYPKSTIIVIESQSQDSVAPSASDPEVFYAANSDPTSTFFSDNIGYGVVNEPLITLPYSGVVSYYRVRVQVNYIQLTPPSTGTTLIVVEGEDSFGATFIRSQAMLKTTVAPIIEMEFIADISQITSVSVFNGTDQPLEYTNPSESVKVLEVEYLGTD